MSAPCRICDILADELRASLDFLCADNVSGADSVGEAYNVLLRFLLSEQWWGAACVPIRDRETITSQLRVLQNCERLVSQKRAHPQIRSALQAAVIAKINQKQRFVAKSLRGERR